MTIITTATSFGVRGVTDTFTAATGDTVNSDVGRITIGSNTDTLRLESTTDNNELTIANADVAFREIRLSTGNASRTGMVATNVDFAYNTSDQITTGWVGRAEFNDCTITKRLSTGDDRVIIGGASAGTEDITYAINGLVLDSRGSTAANLVLHTSSAHPNSTYTGLEFRGSATAELKANGLFYQLTPANTAATGQVDGNDFGYCVRNIHQSLPNANVPADSATGPTEYVVFVENQLEQVVATGSLDGDGVSSNRQAAWQQNRFSAVWMVNPDFGAETNPLNIIFHNTNPPDSNNNAAETRFFVGYNPRFTTPLGTEITTDTKMQIEGVERVDGVNATSGLMEVREVPSAYSLQPPAPVANSEVTVVGTMDRGVWIQDARSRYINKGSATNRDPLTNAELRFIQTRSHTAYIRDFQHDFEFEYALPALGTPTVQGEALQHTTDGLAGANLNDYLNGYATSADAPLNSISDFADVYSSFRRVWFDATRASTQGDMPVTVSGTTLTFDRAVSFATTGNTNYSGNLVTVGSTGTDSTLTGDNTIYNFGAHSVNWNGKRVPARMTLDGGTHNNLNANVSPGGYTVAGVITLNLTRAGGTITGLDDLLGSVTYASGADVSITNNVALTIQINEADIPAEISYTPGSDSLGTNITREDVPTGAATRIIQVPSDQRNGFFAVRNITTDNELVAPIAVASMFSYTVSTSTDESTYNPATDTLRFYWRPTVSSTEAFNTTVFDFTGTVTEGTTDLAPQRIAAVLWESVVSTDVGSATADIVDGSFDHNSVDRFALNFTGALLGTSDAAAQAKTLYLGLLATNDINYLERMIDNELATGEDIITPGINELIVDTDYAYVTSGDLTVQQQVTSISGSAGSTGTLVPQDLSIGAVSSVIILPNPAGATPAVIASAVGTGVAVGVDASDVANAVAWLASNGDTSEGNLSTDGGNLIGLLPKVGDYDETHDYRGIL